MANTGSYPIAIQPTAAAAAPAAPVASAAERAAELRTAGLVLMAVLGVGSLAAAAGIQLEGMGYGALSIAAGGVLTFACGVPLSLLVLRRR